MDDNRIGRYENGRRVLPALTLTGKTVTLPVLNTRNLAPGYFVVLDMSMPKRFDVEAEIEKLTTAVGGTIQPRVGEQLIEDANPPFQSAPPPEVFGSFGSDVPGDSDVSGTKGRK